MFGLGMPELLVIFVIIFLLFGAKRLPDIAKALGKAIREFKNPSEGEDKEKPHLENKDQGKEREDKED
jgi:sec-independent protein translocase protein TatA